MCAYGAVDENFRFDTHVLKGVEKLVDPGGVGVGLALYRTRPLRTILGDYAVARDGLCTLCSGQVVRCCLRAFSRRGRLCGRRDEESRATGGWPGRRRRAAAPGRTGTSPCPVGTRAKMRQAARAGRHEWQAGAAPLAKAEQKKLGTRAPHRVHVDRRVLGVRDALEGPTQADRLGAAAGGEVGKLRHDYRGGADGALLCWSELRSTSQVRISSATCHPDLCTYNEAVICNY